MSTSIISPNIGQPIFDALNTVSIGAGIGNTISTYGNNGTIGISEDAIKRFNLNELQYAIRGEMIIAQKVMSDLDYFDMESKMQVKVSDSIKQELVYKLAEEMMRNNKILFTAQADPSTGERTFRASIYATSDTNVQILKEYRKRNT
jgi:hypothetical protein